MITRDMIAYERSKHFIGENMIAENIICTTDRKVRKKEKVRVVGLFRDFLIVTNGYYNWCINYQDFFEEEPADGMETSLFE